MEYLPRIVDTELDALAEAPAVSIEGARGVGKTATAMRRARTVHRLDDPGQLEVIASEPRRVTDGEPPVLIDEWQRLPASWDLVRRAVDADPRPGRFLLTGSATPTEAPAHTGAGRIISMKMRPLSLAERGLADPTVSLSGLLTGNRGRLDGAAEVGVEHYVDEIIRSGFPGIRPHPDRIRRGLLDGYIDQILNHDVHQFGHTFRDEGSLRRWITAYAAAVSTATSFEKIRDAASAGHDDRPARTTTIPYRSALEGLRLIEEVPAWLPTRNRLRRVASAPVHQLTDPALAARLLGVGTEALIAGTEGWGGDGTLLGALFESLMTLSVRVYAQACETRVYHLRTQGGEREIDLIIERADGAIVALEVKLKSVINDRDVRHLQWLRDQIGSRMLDAAVLSTGQQAYRRADGVGVIPAVLLGP